MVQHKGLVREAGHHLTGHGQVPGKDEDVVGQVELGQGGDPAQEIVAEHELVVGLVLDDVAHAAELGMGAKALQLRPQVGAHTGPPSRRRP